jgi:hypothetical protein
MPGAGEVFSYKAGKEDKAMKKYDVLQPGQRMRMAGWIEHRGGVRVWENINLSNPDGGSWYTPALTEDGRETPTPHWGVARGELLKDIRQLRFMAAEKKVNLVRIATRMGTQGLMVKLTDHSSKKVTLACQAAKEKYGEDAMYSFGGWDGKDCIISIPIWEEGDE